MATNTEKLFARFQAIYGGRWSACYATPEAVDMAIAEWSEVVERMTDKQLVEAIAWAKTSCPWPPSIAEFLHAGLGIDEEVIRDVAILAMRRAGISCATYRELDAAAKLGRARALRNLIEEGLRPAIEDQRPERIGAWSDGGQIAKTTHR